MLTTVQPTLTRASAISMDNIKYSVMIQRYSVIESLPKL